MRFSLSRAEHRQNLLRFVAYVSVGASTLRAFRGRKRRPKDIVFEFADRLVADGRLTGAKSRTAFDRRLLHWIDRFPAGQVRLKSRSMGYGHKAKVVNLCLKTLVFTNGALPLIQSRRLEKWLHVPIDSRVHGWLWDKLGRELSSYRQGRFTRKNTQLKELNRRCYWELQSFLCARAMGGGFLPIWIDFVAWPRRSGSKSEGGTT